MKLLYFECMSIKQSMADTETHQESLFFLRQTLLSENYYKTGKVVNIPRLDKDTTGTAAPKRVNYQNNTATYQRFV